MSPGAIPPRPENWVAELLKRGLVVEGPKLEDGRPAILLPGIEWRPAYWALRRRERRLPTPARLPARPRGLLAHSGELGQNTAAWARRGDGTAAHPNGAARFWAQLAYDADRGAYVHTDSLDAWSPHGGPLNRWTLGVETCHFTGDHRHAPQDGSHRDQTVELFQRLAILLDGDGFVVGHRFIERDKRDPGSAVTADWFSGSGLRVYWSWQGEGGGALIEAEGLR